jgi:hypothetical protein
MDGETVKFPKEREVSPVTGTAGVRGHAFGMAATVSALAAASGGIHPGGLVTTDTK